MKDEGIFAEIQWHMFRSVRRRLYCCPELPLCWDLWEILRLVTHSTRTFQRCPGACSSTCERDHCLLKYIELHNKIRTELVKLLFFAWKSFFSGNKHLSLHVWLLSWHCMFTYCVAKAGMFIWSWATLPLLSNALWYKQGLFSLLFFLFIFWKCTAKTAKIIHGVQA